MLLTTEILCAPSVSSCLSGECLLNVVHHGGTEDTEGRSLP
jgi:hypothetical protein